MSKIEKALGKARAFGALQTVPSFLLRQGGMNPPDHGANALIEQRMGAIQSIARMREKSVIDKQMLVKNRILDHEMGENATVRAFREIRTKIIQQSQGRNCVIMVTTVAGGGGSSFVAINLGVAFSFDAGKTALLVDCNFRNPSMHRLVAADASAGLTDYLDDSGMDVAEIIHSVGIRRLRVIASGSRREITSEYFTSPRMRQVVEGLKQRYRERYVIMDAPPVIESADMQIIAELCDYVVLVVPYGRVTDSQIDACIKSIGEEKLMGVVFNDEPVPPSLNWRSVLNPFAALWRNVFRP